MSAIAGTAEVAAYDPNNDAGDELVLSCIVCRGRPPTKDRVGVIAHCRCLNDAGSL